MSNSLTACTPGPLALRHNTHGNLSLGGTFSSSGRGPLQGAPAFCRRAQTPRCSATNGSERSAVDTTSAPAADRGAGASPAPLAGLSGPTAQHIVPFRSSGSDTSTSSAPASGQAAAGTELGAAEAPASLRGSNAGRTWPTVAARQGLYSDVPVDRVSQWWGCKGMGVCVCVCALLA